METSEVLDLSKENIQPLKTGRNVAKLGTALQAQTDAELHQKILAEREKFELLIRMYEGDDPIQPHYDYVKWIEQTFPKHGPNSNIVQVLENALTTFKDDPRYKQDLRYAELLVKFIDTQPNPLEVYQVVYDQGLCTMCAPFYKAWADELDKINDFKTADQIFNLGIRVRAEPVAMLKEAHLHFQASVGRRMLGLGQQEETAESDPDYNRQALHKLQKRNIHSHRTPTGVPGQVKQQAPALSSKNINSSNTPFKIYQGDDSDMGGYGDGYGKAFPKHSVVSKENTQKAGPWSQHGGKYHSKQQPTGPTTPSFKVHEDEGADINSGHHKMSSVPRALKTLKKDDFWCPLAVFEPPDPTKRPMYCKNKVYAGGREFQFEELRAAIYNRRYEQAAALKIQEDLENEMKMKETPIEETSERETQKEVFSESLKSSISNSNLPTPTTVKNEQSTVKEEYTGSKEPPAFQPHLQSPLVRNQEKYEDLTCNTQAFGFVLPSSTPLVGHCKPASSTSNQPNKQCINGSYIVEDAKKFVTKQELSILFEASKERYSSSSGSSGQTQGSVCTVGNVSLPPVQPELVEKLAQISADQSDLEKSFACLSVAGPVDPFSVELITQLLTHIRYPSKHHLIGLHRFDTDAPPLQTNSTAKLGDVKYSVVGELGKGNYARVLKALKDGQPVALKQQRPAWEWEWYIVQELQSRLPPNMMGGFLYMNNGYIYRNASILESEWAKYGSILSVINKLKISWKVPDIVLALMFSAQLMSIVEHLHKCKIIHGDIKPDNFVLFSLPTPELSEPWLKLIDFGRSIDMTLLPEGTTFNTVVTTDGFQCNEMKDGRPWTYQTDLYGLAGSIYCVLFYDYMKVVKKDDKWQLSNKIPRYMKPALWQDVFTSLLNVESCEKLPDLTALRETLDHHLRREDKSTINQHIKKLTNVLLNK